MYYPLETQNTPGDEGGTPLRALHSFSFQSMETYRPCSFLIVKKCYHMFLIGYSKGSSSEQSCKGTTGVSKKEPPNIGGTKYGDQNNLN